MGARLITAASCSCTTLSKWPINTFTCACMDDMDGNTYTKGREMRWDEREDNTDLRDSDISCQEMLLIVTTDLHVILLLF